MRDSGVRIEGHEMKYSILQVVLTTSMTLEHRTVMQGCLESQDLQAPTVVGYLGVPGK